LRFHRKSGNTRLAGVVVASGIFEMLFKSEDYQIERKNSNKTENCVDDKKVMCFGDLLV